MKSVRGVSALVITMNEAHRLGRCLASLAWADEIVVLDGGSSDNTHEICNDPRQPWADVIQYVHVPWRGFLNQRNEALARARHDWVLVVDSDEAVSPELAARIRSMMAAPEEPPYRAYKVRRVEYFLGRPIRAGIWNPSWQDRFFHRAGVRYINNVHEYPVFAEPPGRIAEPIHHDPSFDLDRFLAKMNAYTTIEAQDRVRQGMRTHPIRMLTAFPAMFLKNYFYYKSYRDGWHGFVISILEGISRAVRHVKIWYYSTQSILPSKSNDAPLLASTFQFDPARGASPAKAPREDSVRPSDGHV
jgi:glycosyltransferase involved in cell wall biosynthesis